MARVETERKTLEMPAEEERATVAIERDRLLDLIDQTASPPLQRAHTVPREQLQSRDAVQRAAVWPSLPAPDDDLDIDIRPSLSPLLVLGVIALLLTVFVVATQLR